MTCKECYWSGIVDLYKPCPYCNPQKEKQEVVLKAPDDNCRKCWWTWLDWYWNPCICRY